MILAAARDVDRPIFYSVAVIIAGYIPIYVLHGPSGKLFHPMADTMGVALIGSLILTLTLVPVLLRYWFKGGVREKRNRAYRVGQERVRVGIEVVHPAALAHDDRVRDYPGFDAYC